MLKLIWLLCFCIYIEANPSNRISNVPIGCVVDISKDLHPNEPIFFDKNNELLTPSKNGSFEWNHGYEFFMGCKEEITKIACAGGNSFRRDDKTPLVKFKDLKCGKQNIAVIEKTDSIPSYKCDDTKYKIGFKVKSTFIPLFYVCYNLTECSPVYTIHKLTNSKRLSGTNLNQNFREYTADSDKQVMKPCSGFDNAYTKQNTTILNKLKNVGKNRFQRGHLVPAADAIFMSWKKATYLYANTAPEWEIINEQGGSWGIMENKVRNYAEQSVGPLEVITGVFDHLTLEYENGTEREIYLKVGQKIPAPKYLYKIVLDHQDKKAIAFVVQQNMVEDEKIGKGIGTVCPQAKWHDQKFDNLKFGKTYCYKLKDLWKILHPESANKFDDYEVLYNPGNKRG